MAALSKVVVQKIYRGLTGCIVKSDFDRDFLRNNSIEFLCGYESEQWIEVLSSRSIFLRRSAYDWTKIGLGLNSDWSRSKQHTNYHWYQLAVKLSELTGKHITQILFPGVIIAEKDLSHLNNLKQFSSLIYTDNFERLVMLNRMLKISEHSVSSFANYDSTGNKHAVSLNELLQIRWKLTQVNEFYKPIVIANWNEFREQYIALWGVQSPSWNFEDLIYPLYEVVGNYFEELENPRILRNTQDLLQVFYKQHLEGLNSHEANFFYGQCVERGTTSSASLYVQDILLNLLDAAEDINSVLPDMVKLAVWITQQNPAMVIAHPDVLRIYRSQEIGPYLTQRKLGNELAILVRFRDELNEEDLTLIRTLKERLLTNESEVEELLPNQLHRGLVPEDELRDQLSGMFNLRDEYNRTETFVGISRAGIINGSYQYLHHRTGANTQYIRVGRLLQASGFLKRHGIEDYFQLLMPWLLSPIDAVTKDYLSTKPLSHYGLPEKDRYYLIYLGNSVEQHKRNQCFYNINTAKAVPFSPKEFENIFLYAAQKFCKYSRIPRFTNYSLRASTLKQLVDLVNNSLNYEATQDGDGYRLREGFSQCWVQLPEKLIEYEIERHGISYQIRDSWNKERIYTDNITFKSAAEFRAFTLGIPAQRLMYILHIAMRRGHARANISISKYYKAYIAYSKFGQFYLELDRDERERLDKISMRYGAAVRTFGEVWANGFPDCMSAASKWFSTLILDYLPELRFRSDLEYNPKYNDYLFYARRDSQHLYKHYIENDLTASIGELVQSLTHVSVQVTSFAGLKAKGMELLGVTTDELVVKQGTARLLSIADSAISLSVSQFSLFGVGKKQDLSGPCSEISSGTTSERGSFYSPSEDNDYTFSTSEDQGGVSSGSECSSGSVFSSKHECVSGREEHNFLHTNSVY